MTTATYHSFLLWTKALPALLGCLLTAAMAAPASAAEEPYPLVDAVEHHARAGLPNFIAKANTPDAEVKVGYLGGSITAQPGYRVKSLAHFQKMFPKAKFAEINAAIGGTGADLGVFRVQQDVLDHLPDLMFIEFATNDGGASPQQIRRCMEGIVRQTWKKLPKCDIVFVYTITEPFGPTLADGKYPRSASVMEAVAEHYQIPTIHMGMEVAKLAKEGKLLWKAPLPKTDAERQAAGDKVAFANDGVHPYTETGHELYQKAIVAALAPIVEASKNPGEHTLIEPLDPANLENAKIVPLSEAKLSGVDRLDPAKDALARRFKDRLPQLYKVSKAGSAIEFKFKGTRAAIYDLLGPDCGQVVVTLDDQPLRVAPRIDVYSTYHRLGTLNLAYDVPDAVHTVKIELSPDSPDKAKIVGSKPEYKSDPKRFEGSSFYPGAILLVGEIVK